MKKLVWLMGVWMAGAASAQGAEPFSQRVKPEEFGAAGLAKLSAGELARLDALFEQYSGRRAEAPSATEPKAPTRATSAPTVTAPVPTAATVPAATVAQKGGDDGLLAKAKKVFVRPGTRAEATAIAGQIDGWFDGWTRDTTWKLKDGTRWRADNHQPPLMIRPVKDPTVKIYPAAVNGYWLELPELEQKVRVVQLP